MIEAVQQVDVVKDAWDKWAFWIAVLSSVGSLVAVVIAVLAQRGARAAREAIVKERRRQFELELLRDMVEICDEKSFLVFAWWQPSTALQWAHRVRLLPEDEFPVVRGFPTAGSTYRIALLLGASDEEAGQLSNKADEVFDKWSNVFRERVLSELLERIDRRVNAIDS